MAVLHRQTVGNVYLLEVDADPNGNVTAPKGSLALDSTNGKSWTNTDAGTTWADVSSPASAVLEADYNANTVLAATDDDTPVAVTLAASTIFGRKASGGPAAMTAAEARTVLNVEDGAAADQTGAEIKTAYEGEADTNAFTDTLLSKLNGIEANATADQTGAEIKTAYEGEADTNAYTDAEKTKLSGIEASADVTDDANVRSALAGATAAIAINSQDLTGVAELQQKDHADFAGSDRFVTTAAVQTTDATPTTLLSLALSDDAVYWVEANVCARGTTGTDENAYKVFAKFSRRSAGSAALGSAGSVNLFTDEEELSWNVAWIASGNNAVLQVTGEASVSVNWTASVSYQRVSGSS